MEEGKPGESLTLGAEGARPSVAAGAAGEELDFLATPPKTQPPAPAPHRAHPAPRSRSGSPAGTGRSGSPAGPPPLCAALCLRGKGWWWWGGKVHGVPLPTHTDPCWFPSTGGHLSGCHPAAGRRSRDAGHPPALPRESKQKWSFGVGARRLQFWGAGVECCGSGCGAEGGRGLGPAAPAPFCFV